MADRTVPQSSYFDATHEMARQTARRFVDEAVRPHIDDWEEAGSFPRELYRRAGELGLLGIGHPARLGGSGEGDVFLKIAVAEELMRSGSGGFVAGLGSLDIGLPPIWRMGSEALQQRLVPPVLAGEKIAALAITEPGGGSDVANLRTRAVRDGDHYVVNGSKTFITSGSRADVVTVAVRTGGPGHAGVSLLAIERGTPGFSTGAPLRKMGWWASDTAELFFQDCRVPASQLIGPENTGFLTLMLNFQAERLALAVMAYMTAQLALEACLDWARTRQTFGKPLVRHQVIRHKLADMAVQVDVAREYTWRCAARIAAGETLVREVSMAKNAATDAAEHVTHEAVQIFGGMGYMRGSLVERLYRDCRILSIGGGTREIMNEIIARQMGL
ncbi:MAG: acyl-CoA dehydrogenase family protein [Pseudomonadota bacterium]